MKRFFAIICVGAVLLISFNGCKDAAQSDARGTKVNAPETFPIVDEPVTLRVLKGSDVYIADYFANEYTKYYQEKTNVNIDWDIASGDMQQKLNLIFASGEYPDVFLACGINPSIQSVYGQGGVFKPLNDLIDKYAPNIKQAFLDNPGMKESITTPDGNIYGLPEIRYNFAESHALKMWVYKPWLKNLGIDLPQTTEEFINMLIAFRDKDPNGNGIKDEIPLLGINENSDRSVFPFLISPFIYSGWASEPLIVEDGQIVFTADKSQYKDALVFMNRLYKENLLTNDSFTMNRQQRIAIGDNPDTVILGCAPAQSPLGMFTTIEERIYEYVTIPPLQGPNGVRQVALCDAPITGSHFNISSTCKNPEVAMRWVDYFYSFQGRMEAEFGLEGEGWRYAEPEELVDGYDAKYTAKVLDELMPMESGQNKRWRLTVPRYRPSFYQVIPATSSGLSALLEEETRKNYEPYGQFKRLPTLYFDEATASEVGELKASIESYVAEARVQFITGAKNLDSDWESYLGELKLLGIDRYVEINQKTYDESPIKLNLDWRR